MGIQDRAPAGQSRNGPLILEKNVGLPLRGEHHQISSGLGSYWTGEMVLHRPCDLHGGILVTKPIRFIVLLFVGILAWTPIAFAKGVGSVCVWQDDVNDVFVYLGVVDIFDHSGSSAAEVYSYGIPYAASYNGSTPPALSGISQLFVVQTNDGDGPSLFFVHDEPVDGSGGAARTGYLFARGRGRRTRIRRSG